MISPLAHPYPRPPTLANVSAAYFAARFALVETMFWLYTVRLVGPRVYAGDVPIGWAPASMTVIFLGLTLPAGILVWRARYTPFAFLLAFMAAPAYMLAWKYGVGRLR